MGSVCSNRVMLAAPRSQSGKTTITCAMLEALKQRGLNPISFKCGPDYIDPLFHKKVLGIDSRNLDTFLAGKEAIKSIVADQKGRYAVIEGVMGLYDGTSVESTDGSSYEVAEILDCPIILIVDASGIGRTVISLIKGMLLDDNKHLIKGIILNKISAMFYTSLSPVLEKEISKVRDDVKLLGYFPKDPSICIESRHLGLKLPNEIYDIKVKILNAASVLEKAVDITDVISIMEKAGEIVTKSALGEGECVPEAEEKSLTLAVAYDDAFCFYYRDNLDLFREQGVRIRFFSPIEDEALPERIDGILLGGGYPENYLKELSANSSMRESIKNALDKGIPSLAECGGFMYLHKNITDIDGNSYEMVGAIDGECHYAGHLVRFGYMQIEDVNDDGGHDGLCAALKGMRGHEFHYYDSSMNGEAYIAGKPNKNKKWDCMITQNNGIWGFPHFYYNSDPEFIRLFIERMKEVKSGEFQ